MSEQQAPNPGEMDRLVEAPELTIVDIDLARQQCVHQNATSPEQIQGMIDALGHAKALAFSEEELDAEKMTSLILELGSMVEPTEARKWRSVPATFQNGDHGEAPENIEHTIASWAEAFAEARLEPDELYYYFEKIHPFLDGNGRIGHCIWAIAQKRQTGNWPTTLPPDAFGQGFEKQPQSAFGEIENSEGH